MIEANLEIREDEVIDLCSESDRVPKRTEWDTSSESGTEIEPPRKSPRSTHDLLPDKIYLHLANT